MNERRTVDPAVLDAIQFAASDNLDKMRVTDGTYSALLDWYGVATAESDKGVSMAERILLADETIRDHISHIDMRSYNLADVARARVIGRRTLLANTFIGGSIPEE